MAAAGAGGLGEAAAGAGDGAATASDGGRRDPVGSSGAAAGDENSSGMGGVLVQSGGAAGEGGETTLGAGGASDCAPVVQQQALSIGNHVAACSDVVYATNPPSSGEHYPIWADFGVYDFALPRGYWVHNLEHGAVVVTYNCPNGCKEDVARATAWLAQLLPDAACPAGRPRVLLVPDPKLDAAWAASSWGFTLRASCFDAAAFSDFYLSHAGQPLAPEAGLCGAGTDFRAAGANTCGANGP